MYNFPFSVLQYLSFIPDYLYIRSARIHFSFNLECTILLYVPNAQTNTLIIIKFSSPRNKNTITINTLILIINCFDFDFIYLTKNRSYFPRKLAFTFENIMQVLFLGRCPFQHTHYLSYNSFALLQFFFLKEINMSLQIPKR